ncbi:inositol polyphosphate 5-phosphatase K-like [Planococcus citri]|uniref:inositol polyphosphate 5-phosphatase K-like n=1 Tax=Planococcus citri TaxID=170843 RepID=UPI0031FA489D
MDTLRIYIITWNVATRSPDENMLDLLDVKKFKNKDSLPDFYIIGLQEVKSQPQNYVMDTFFNDPWTNAFKTALAPYDYVKVKTSRLVGLLLNIFCLRKHVVHLRDIYTEQTRTGLMGFWGNKGAVTTRLQIYGCSVCFVNCHLAPHDNFVKERIDDYNTILQGQKFTVKDTTTILFHDYVFWFGDLNFRLDDEISLPANVIIKKIESNQIASLLDHDQLKQVMASGEAFSELIENGPTFQPTYKYNFHSQVYDPKRRPAWTDRILYRVNKFAYENITLDVKQISYKSYDQYLLSDHKPVASEITMKVFSNYTERQVELKPVDSWVIDSENKAIVTMEADVTPSDWDWIGVFKDNFTGLDEYVTYVFLPISTHENHSNDSECEGESMVATSSAVNQPCTSYVVTFPDTAIRAPGNYRLLYFTKNSDSILGMSECFTVEETPGCRVPMDW